MEGAASAAHEAVLSPAFGGASRETRNIASRGRHRLHGIPDGDPSVGSGAGTTACGYCRATRADGSETTLPYYGVTPLRDGRTRYVEADAADTTPLVGMRLLDGHSLSVDVEDGGRVVIEPRATG